MKSNLIRSAILSVSLLVGSHALDMQPTFRLGASKNIAFSAFMCGSSHHTWVLSIIDTLRERGHNVSYLTTTEDTRFGQPYANVKTVDIGPEFSYDKAWFSSYLSTPGVSMLDIMAKLTRLMAIDYERDYHTLVDYFKSNRIDVALCDYFMVACVDAANTLEIPFIVTSATDPTSESAKPYINNDMALMDDYTTEFQGLFQRFKNNYILPLEMAYNYRSYMKDMSARRKALGIKTKFKLAEKSWEDSMKLINSAIGFTPARPIGPMAEFVGPIIPKKYKPLTPELSDFLALHQRVAYIAFGQLAVPSQCNIQLILTGLLESIEAGFFDAFIWATVNSVESFPETITTSLGTTYYIKDMLNHNHPYACLIKWAPQTAILLHPSTFVFVSHGGLGSWYESMYAGTPMIMFPFFGDQRGNALLIKRNRLGGLLRPDASITEAVHLFKKIAEDKDGDIKENVKRMQALTQIRSQNGVLRGADVIEEVLFTHKRSKLPHRQSVDRHMSYIKSHNLNIFTILVLGISLVCAFVCYAGYKTYGYVQTEFCKQQKIKMP